MKELVWKKGTGELLHRSLEEEVTAVLIKEKAAGGELKVCIGTDSQVKPGARGKQVEFATVIVFLRKGKGGFMFVRSEKVDRLMSIKARMIEEVSKSIEVAYALNDLFVRYNVDLEVHADINTNPRFKSNDALKDAMGYITGMGFAFKAKPAAFASSSCANKQVH